jgi:hypothetical protein
MYFVFFPNSYTKYYSYESFVSLVIYHLPSTPVFLKSIRYQFELNITNLEGFLDCPGRCPASGANIPFAGLLQDSYSPFASLGLRHQIMDAWKPTCSSIITHTLCKIGTEKWNHTNSCFPNYKLISKFITFKLAHKSLRPLLSNYFEPSLIIYVPLDCICVKHDLWI